MAVSRRAPVDIEGMFTVAGHEIYLSCSGGPGPTVIFEAAGGEDHMSFLPIAQRIRNRAYACVYDRTGVGRSTKPMPAVAARDHVAELHELLELAGVPRPAVVVGHSYGGIVALMETVEHPEDVAGLILIDSSHPAQRERVNAVMTEAQVELEREWYDQLAEILDLPASLQQAAAEYGPLPAIPLTVITATKVDADDGLPADFPREAIKAVWLELQVEHARLRPDARHVKAATGHYVHVDDPDLVVDEIIHMLQPLASPRWQPAQARPRGDA
ncbi:MAG: alpha/beta hydrolase [Candidatus Limnocylindria bacterium]